MNKIKNTLLIALIGAGLLMLPVSTFAQSNDEAPADKPTTAAEEAPEEKAPPPKLPDQPTKVSAETLRMLEIIERKNRELKKREEDLLVKEKNLRVLEGKIRQDLQLIETALAESEKQVGIRKDLIEQNVNSLVKVFSVMKPKEAASLLEVMDQDIAIHIISKMKSKVAGKVLSKMKTRVAKNISERIAGKRDKKTPGR